MLIGPFFSATSITLFRLIGHSLRKPKTAALHVGVAVHAVLSDWNRTRWRQQPLGLGELHASYQEMWIAGQIEEPVV